jgi:hypothetical protein
MKQRILGLAIVAAFAKSYINKTVIIILLIATFLSCKEAAEQSIEVISVKLNEAQSIDLSQGRMIELETTDSSLLYDIARIAFLKEKLFILTRNKVVVFDSNGKYLFNLSGVGQAPHEYTALANLFVKDEQVYLFDSMAKKILCFDANGNFISSANIPPDNPYPLSDIYPLKDGKYVGKNMFQGDHVSTPIGSILDERYNTVDVIEGKNVVTGMTVYDNFFQYQDEVLYWEALCDTIFSIPDAKKMSPEYYVDFGEYAIPQAERRGKEVYDLIDYTNKPENINKTATFIRYVNEDDRYLRFMFAFRNKTPFVFYDKQQKTARVYFFEDKNNAFVPVLFAYYYNHAVYLSVMSETDMEKNPYLFVFDESVFK